MKQLFPLVLALLFLLTACSSSAAGKTSSATAQSTTSLPNTQTTVADSNTTGTAGAVSGSSASLSSSVSSDSVAATTTSASSPELNVDFLSGSWSNSDTENSWRVEFFNETECVLCYFPTDSDIDETLLGTYTIENDTLTVDGHDRLNDAYLTVSFRIAGYTEENAKYLDLTYLTTDFDLFSLKNGEMLTVKWESNEFYLKDVEKPYAEIQYTILDGDWNVELPVIMNANTAVLQEINDILMTNWEYAEDLYQKHDDTVWLEWKSYLYQEDNMIQILLVQNEYPSYGTDGMLLSWNYNCDTDQDIYVQDKIKELSLSDETLLNAIQTAAKVPVDINGAYASAYLITDKNTINFYYTVPQTPEGADTWLTFYTVSYDLSAKTCTASEGLLLP